MGKGMNMGDFIKQDIPIWTRNTRKEIDAYTKTQPFQFGLGHTIIPRDVSYFQDMGDINKIQLPFTLKIQMPT